MHARVGVTQTQEKVESEEAFRKSTTPAHRVAEIKNDKLSE